MRKTLFLGIAATMLFQTANAEGGTTPKKLPLLKPVRFVTNAEKLAKASQMEAKSAQITGTTKPSSNTAKRGGGSNSTQAMDIAYIDLGASINPFTVVTGGRNCVSVVPELNTVALIRRGGPNDNGGTTNAPGNKVFFDLNTYGGAENKWRLSNGPIFTDDIYTQAPTYDPAGANHGPRYPQGAIWNPAGNTDTANAYAFTMAAVLDGTNGTWGGFGTGWRKFAAGSPATVHLWNSPDPLHYISESMEVTSTGSIFAMNAERDASGTGVAYTDKITLYRYNYNSTTQTFDSTITYFPFSNEGGDYATVIGSTQIAFGNDGLTGYVALAAANNEFDSTATFLPYIAKTTDGGNTWTGFKKIAINKRLDEQPSPQKDGFRDSLLIGNYVRFTEAGEVVPTTFDDPTKHPVDYLVNDMDLTVDKNNTAHIFASLTVSGFGDTLNATFPGGITYYPGYGSWNVDFYINSMDSSARGIYINQNVGLNGCWGDCAGTESITEANRPGISRSADGSIIAFVWYDTDSAAHPQLTDDNNSNPDMWIRTMRVGDLSYGDFRLNARPRNITKGTDKDGLAILGNVAPKLLNTATGHAVASTIVALGDFTGVTSPWTSQHIYVSGVAVPPASAIDSFPVQVNIGQLIAKNKEVASTVASRMELKVSPVPSQGMFTAHVNSPVSGQAEFVLVNSIGQVVLKKSVTMGQGEFHVPFNIRALNAGVYTLQIRNGSNVAVQRIVKQ
jgi:hypothetical protein